MSLDAQGAEVILKKQDLDFYSSIVEEYSEGFPVTSPLSKDKQLYWEEKLKNKYPEAYPIYYFSKLDAFTFFVGLTARDTEEENVRAQLGNLQAGIDFLDEARRSDQYDDVSEQMLHLLNIAITVQKNYPLAGSILTAQLYYGWALEYKENPPVAKIYAAQAKSALLEATIYGYGGEAYYKHIGYDHRLTVNKEEVISDLEGLQLLVPEAKEECVVGAVTSQRMT